ncbi:MAG: DUF3306 domain-containing protein [Bradyrhizobium icense]|nr:MAG: DUF3306 domain-containing protein [Bradyrhizobium icense]
MSDEEFLKRWSRRKQEARQEKAAEQPSPLPAEVDIPASDVFESETESDIDLSKLPSLDEITATTDITEFLRKGVPTELGHAALRRAWAADPAIRDFVGLAENAWDFTDPNAMPGFGALEGSPEQISAMIERVMGSVRNATEKLVSELPEKEQLQQIGDQSADISVPDEAPEAAAEPVRPPSGVHEAVVAAQPEASNKDHNGDTLPRRSHGGALPS